MNDRPSSFSERVNSAPSKQAMVDAIVSSGHFIVGEQPKVVSNGLSTDLLVFPSDRLPQNSNRLARKIDTAMEYAASFTDVERLNALQYVPGAYKEGEATASRVYLTLGLYLYFADECSRKNPSTTFLTAMRRAKAVLPGGTEFDDTHLSQKVLKALKTAGIATKKNREILRQWHEEGRYSIGGEVHEMDAQAQPRGAYVQLAHKIEEKFHDAHKDGNVLGINEAISYALGNKQHMRALQDDAEAYRHVQETVANPELITRHIKEGDKTRREKINTEIRKAFQGFEAPPHAERMGHERIARQILSYFPEPALELVLREGYSFVYADAPSIEGVFPAGRIPGSLEELTQETRTGIAAHLPRYKTIFVSNGIRSDKVQASTEVKQMRMAQSLLHETMHLAIRHMDMSKIIRLEHLADRVSHALRRGNTEENSDKNRQEFDYVALGTKDEGKLQTLEKNSLAEVLDKHSTLYDGYREQAARPGKGSPDMRGQEVVCNLFGLIHTEFRDKENPNNLIYHPPPGLEVVREFAEAADVCYRNALEKLKAQQEAKGVSLPNISGSVGR